MKIMKTQTEFGRGSERHIQRERERGERERERKRKRKRERGSGGGERESMRADAHERESDKRDLLYEVCMRASR
jgi:hypothetical protein